MATETTTTLRCIVFGHRWIEPRTGLAVNRYYPNAMGRLPGLAVVCARCGRPERVGREASDGD